MGNVLAKEFLQKITHINSLQELHHICAHNRMSLFSSNLMGHNAAFYFGKVENKYS